MNLSYLKYAVEVEKTGSITKAAQNFYMNQPHLSKIIRELERDLGCPIFDRTSRGMVPTRRGEEFLRYAKAILAQEEQIEALCVKNSERALEVSLSVPRATYISYAFTDYLKDMRAFPASAIRRPTPRIPYAACPPRPLTWGSYAARPYTNIIT